MGTIAAVTVTAGETAEVNVGSHFRDPDGDALTYAASTSDPRIAAASVSGAVVTVSGVSPGAATITVTATDPHGASAQQQFPVTVERPNSAPVLVEGLESGTSDTLFLGETDTFPGSQIFADPDGDPLTYSASSTDPSVLRVWTESGDTIIGYEATGLGTARATFVATDPGGLSATFWGDLTVLQPNRPPERRGSIPTQQMRPGEVRDLDVAAFFADPDGDPLVYDAGFEGEGVRSVTVSGSVVTLEAGRTGTASVTVAATDPSGEFAEQHFQVSVQNRAPIATGGLFPRTIAVGDSVLVNVAENFHDPDGDPLTFEASSSNTAAATVTTVGSTVTVKGEAAGTATITVTATDPGGLTATHRFEATVADSDRDALMALYDATGGPNWTNNANWGTNAPLNDWHGVTANAAGRVTRLFLRQNNLSGVIPPEIGSLASLEVLYLSGDNLTGAIPRTLGNLTNLTSLTLGDNDLSGTIPRELGNLASLTRLWLGSNSLTGSIPPELGDLASLTRLTLDNNDLSGSVPRELGNLVSLTALQLGLNDLSGTIPRELGNLTSLTTLSLNNNDLAGTIPRELGDLASLTWLTLDNNSLTGTLPDSFQNLSLEYFYWDGNAGLCAPATDAFRRWLGGIANHRPGPWCASDRDALMALYNATGGTNWTNNANWGTNAPLNDWHGVTANAAGRVTELDLRRTGLSGSIPPELGGLDSLAVLFLDYNGLSGSIPPELGNLASLMMLGLEHNNLSGSIPATLGQLSALEELVLFSNNLSGSIPPELGDLASLTELTLRRNNLSGSIPAELGDLVSLTRLDLGGNNLSGTIPPALGDLASLTRLLLETNKLTGPIPDSFQNLSLEYFYWDGNAGLCAPATAAFRTWLGGIANHRPGPWCASDRDALMALYNATGGANWTNNANWGTNAPLNNWYGVGADAAGRVVRLDLYSNNLSGVIPPAIGSLASLEGLDVFNNSLAGNIPPQLGNLASLRDLYLGDNNLTGPIPPQLGTIAGLRNLYLGGNNLSGTVPPQLGSLASLVTLTLYENNLSGAIPPEFGQLSALEALHLYNNANLSGPLPLELAALSALQSFRYGGTGLCVPADAAVRAWLAGIGDHRGTNRDCASSDRDALMALYNATGGPNWTNNANWGTNAPLNDWHGVTANAAGRVTELTLNGNNLSDSIPSELAGLASLRELALFGNDLTGSIPPELGTLDSLTRLVLSSNNLSGSIPPDFGALASLTALNLGSNNLSGSIPPEFGNLASLTFLDLRANDLAGSIPSALGGLVNLEHLNLYNNVLTGSIPPELGNLASLGTLHLGRRNALSGSIPPELGGLASLRVLTLDGLRLTGEIPDSFLNLPLEYFHWFGNAGLCAPATDAFRAWLGGIATHRPGPWCASDRDALMALYDATGGPNWANNANWGTNAPLNDWHGVTADAAERVTELELVGNNLSGTVPSELGGLASLKELVLFNNDLTGSIPPELGTLDSLTWLELGSNNLSGSIPPQLGTLAGLEGLNLRANSLTGSIPPELGNLTSLIVLVLASNDLSGSVPATLGQLSALTELYLDGNRFAGTLPDSFLNLSLEYFHWFGNAGLCAPATDAFRAWLGGIANHRPGPWCASDRDALMALYNATGGPNWARNANWGTNAPLISWDGVRVNAAGRVVRLDLSSNNLSDTIPPELGNLARLVHLGLQNNSLTGPIPPQLGSLASLETLFLEGNSLTGSIPPELGSLATLVNLSLYDNNLTGSIPPELGGLASLTGLHLAGNNLSGTVPPELGNLASLVALTLSENNLSGAIPPEFGQLSALEVLWLYNNANLSGPLPLELVGLSALQYFSYRGTGLCVPADSALRAWLAGIATHVGTNRDCASPDRDALIALYEATGGANWSSNTNWLTDRPLAEWHGVWTNADGRVTSLGLLNNNLTGSIPAEIGGFDGLTNLSLGENNLSGSIPPELGNLTNLEALSLYDNPRLSGPLPVELAALSSLTVFYYAATGLCVPADAALRAWLAGVTDRRGTIRDCLSTDRDVLVALYDAMDGPNWTNSANWLSDRPLDEWHGVTAGQDERVRALDLSANNLSGEVPPEVGDLAMLDSLFLQDNGLTGRIPARLADTPNLKWLFLSDNSLSGGIPPALGDLDSLEVLALANNDLTGDIPEELGGLTNLKGLALGNNDLTDPIPPALGNLASLEALDLRESRLTGPVPAEFGQLANLRELILSDTGLSGVLPVSLTALRRLEVFDARNTNLCSPIDGPFEAWIERIGDFVVLPCLLLAGEAHLTQVVQSAAQHPAPLVAGEEALLRAFVTARQPTSARIPSARALLYAGAAETQPNWLVDAEAKSVSIPTAVDVGDLSKSINFVVPDFMVQPGLEVVIEIDRGGTLDPALGVPTRIPETGRMAVDVLAVPTLELIVIPFLWQQNPDSAVVDLAAGMAADPAGHELLWDTRTLLPVGDIEVTAHEPVLTATNDAHELLAETGLIHVAEFLENPHDTAHYMGMMSGYVDGPAGVATVGGRSSFSTPRASTMAHELGHNMNLDHAPCGGPDGVDPLFPQRNGSIGDWGYDFRNGELVSPATPDLMSYCSPEWIGSYHFAKAMRHRLAGSASAGTVAADAVGRVLLLWGGVDATGAPFLNPAFVADATPSLPTSGGEYEIAGRAADGRELFSLRFAMPETADGDGRSSFAFALPAPADWAGDLANITLSGPGGSVALDRSTDRPMTLLRDPSSGQVRGILRGARAAASAAAALAGPDLDVLFSRGIPEPTEP